MSLHNMLIQKALCLFSLHFSEVHYYNILDSMSGSGGSAAERFIYTGYGVTTVAVLVGLVISLAWLMGCVCYCCMRHHRRLQRADSNRDVCFLSPTSHNGTLTNSEEKAVQFSYSVNSLASEPAFHHTSLESILSGQDNLQDKTPNAAS